MTAAPARQPRISSLVTTTGPVARLMARRHGRLQRRSLLAIAAVMALCATAEAQPDPTYSRVRHLDARSETLVTRGRLLSSTFRRILQRLESSDLVVYVEAKQPLALPGRLQFVVATPASRFLRVTLRTPGNEFDQVAVLAHELWHAVEIADDASVRDQSTLRHLYERIGFGSGASVDSAQAYVVERKVLCEALSRK